MIRLQADLGDVEELVAPLLPLLFAVEEPDPELPPRLVVLLAVRLPLFSPVVLLVLCPEDVPVAVLPVAARPVP